MQDNVGLRSNRNVLDNAIKHNQNIQKSRSV